MIAKIIRWVNRNHQSFLTWTVRETLLRIPLVRSGTCWSKINFLITFCEHHKVYNHFQSQSSFISSSLTLKQSRLSFKNHLLGQNLRSYVETKISRSTKKKNFIKYLIFEKSGWRHGDHFSFVEENLESKTVFFRRVVRFVF